MVFLGIGFVIIVCMRNVLVFLLLSSCTALAIPQLTIAQTDTPAPSGGGVSIQLEDRFPAPNTTVKATLGGRSVEDVRWFLDGVEISKQPGLRTVYIPIGQSGQTQELQIVRGERVVAERVFRPIYIDLGIDVNGYTPPHYTGAALPVSGSTVQLTALITEHTQVIDPSTYQYHWRINGRTFGGGPIQDHQIQSTIPNTRHMQVELQVILPGVGTVGEIVKFIPVRQSEVFFYELHSLYGLLPYTISSITAQRQGQDILAAPYNTPLSAIQDENITWRVGNRTLENPSDQPLLINPSAVNVSAPASINFRLFDLSTLHNTSANIRVTN